MAMHLEHNVSQAKKKMFQESLCIKLTYKRLLDRNL